MTDTNEANKRYFDEDEKHYQDGNKSALMDTIFRCSLFELPLPRWAASAYKDAYLMVSRAEKNSWDDVFGRPFPKGKHQNAEFKKRTTMWPLYDLVLSRKMQTPDLVIDAVLFDEIGHKFNIGKTLAMEYYYEAKKLAEKT